jgi:hypothetical protein
MTVARRLVSLVAAAALCALSAQAADAATTGHGTTVSVTGATSYEYVKSCSNTAPYPCGTYNGTVQFIISTTNQGSTPITIGYQTVNGSAVAGSDYQAASGTVTIQPSSPQAYVSVTVFNDGVAEPTETMQLKLTSSSSPADLSSVGTGTILDGGQIPVDCDLGKTASNEESMTCTNRPAGQTWYIDADCMGPWADGELVGNQVTGNGTSEGTCSYGRLGLPYFQTV